MKLLFVVNYYYPYVSGVSEYVRILCENLANDGYDVTVLASNHNKLKSKEKINGVNVIRASIVGKISKGTVSPQFIRLAYKLSKQADIVNLHLPMLESGLISSIIDKKKIVTTYQCDVNLTPSLLNSFIVKVMDFSNNLCLKNSNKIVVTSIDYAKHSRIASRYPDKLIEASAPIKNYSRVTIETYKKKRIGFCGRIVEEKGIDVLIKAFHLLSEKHTDIELIVGGDYKNIAGGSIYSQLISYIEKNNIKNVTFVGMIPEEKMAEFYSALDVFVLPSINSLEAFGMVQIEAMYCGTPVVATDLYGVRTIVKKTGMGIVVKKNNVESLADGIEKVINNKKEYIRSKSDIQNYYGTTKCISDYKKCFCDIVNKT